MRKLILVKHAPPQIEPDVVSHRWVLSQDGRESCGWLAEALRDHGVARVYASLEPKALETAALIAVALGADIRPRRGLHEHDRSGLGFLEAADLEARMRRFFAEPGEAIIGHETAQAARARFEIAVRDILREDDAPALAIVAHGTVIALLVAAHNDLEPFDFWKSLGLPSLIALDASSFRLQGGVRTFGDAG